MRSVVHERYSSIIVGEAGKYRDNRSVCKQKPSAEELAKNAAPPSKGRREYADGFSQYLHCSKCRGSPVYISDNLEAVPHMLLKGVKLENNNILEVDTLHTTRRSKRS
ncbi:hypothetical protein KGM_203473 [Danaus plexippus plexippus]|uniref:Uncharacterized protein n=1 Tax=Danaus plexippus plexippus TaxID=278856 RepID=A0A212EZ14_DANPL|nr:hypothetical protein KGM_203473 [Danaus plexippus plexippus]